MDIESNPSEKDLSFQLVENPAPKKLTAEQIEFYNAQGYLSPFTAYSTEEADANRAGFDHLLEQVKAVRGDADSYALNGFQIHCESIYNLAMNPVILDYVEDLLGPEIICWATHYFCKDPGDPKIVPWHQDASYWPLTPSRTVTVWLAIDDADRENAAMKFIPATHNEGHLEWKKTASATVLDQEICGADQMGAAVYNELKAGQFSMHADMLAHGSDANTSDRRRCGLTIRYCPPSVMPMESNWASGAIRCRGTDPAPHWKFNPAPQGDTVPDWKTPVGGN
ncbi:phytanoyl-CoA dioxygenase family protein [Pontiella sulfatireligans]|uniref:Ectoine dioxygenase n=1 Tax=Pontiella sulfatireligans TaxID=2750658 RepID=A0A6C2UCZ6_9BACT|nr:phytanoyl-CoA dioxygenase family protein [Pontiella sulfatireligans]VGO18020.1 Ectoine dioxygenase [Pontiella sulfatireligans]